MPMGKTTEPSLTTAQLPVVETVPAKSAPPARASSVLRMLPGKISRAA
jgi:hypothetical protein